MLHRLLLAGLVVLGVGAATIADAAAQSVEPVIAAAEALAARIASYHRGPAAWRGLTPPPASYCPTMREGEAVLKELARLASRAILFRTPGLALRLQRAGDRLSDELDEEEEINNVAEIPFEIFPCPPAAPFPRRAYIIGPMERRMAGCRVVADSLRLSFEARRAQMQQCLRGHL